MNAYLGDFLFGVEGAEEEVQRGLEKLLTTNKASELWCELGDDLVSEGQNAEDAAASADEESEEFDNFMTSDFARGGLDKPRAKRPVLSIAVQREMEAKERKKIMEDLLMKLPKGVKLLVTEENVPIMKKTTAITEEMKSYTLDPSGPILKFSDMFIAPEPRRIFPRRRKGYRMKPDVVVDGDVDEQDVQQEDRFSVNWFEQHTPQPPPKSQDFVQEGIRIEDPNLEPMTLDEEQPKILEHQQKANETMTTQIYSSIFQSNWEANVLWADSDVPMGNKTKQDSESSEDDGLGDIIDLPDIVERVAPANPLSGISALSGMAGAMGGLGLSVPPSPFARPFLSARPGMGGPPMSPMTPMTPGIPPMTPGLGGHGIPGLPMTPGIPPPGANPFMRGGMPPIPTPGGLGMPGMPMTPGLPSGMSGMPPSFNTPGIPPLTPGAGGLAFLGRGGGMPPMTPGLALGGGLGPPTPAPSTPGPVTMTPSPAPTPVPVNPTTIAPPSTFIRRPAPPAATITTPKMPVPMIRNKSLQNGDWLKNIIWNNNEKEQKQKQCSKLVLDMNDSRMIFEKEGPESESDDEEDDEEADIRQQIRLKAKRRVLKLPGRILTGSDLLLKERQEAIRDLDPFNLSNDRWYIPKASLQTENTAIQHSLVGEKYMATKPQPTKFELRHFHRPRRVFPGPIPLSISASRRRNKKGNALDIIRHQKDISAKDGRIVLLEYMEEFPPILTDLGMGAKIRNYYRRWDMSDIHVVAYPDGENISLQPDPTVDPSPFIADIPNGVAIQSLENNLYKVPIFHHTPHPTDFLLIRGTKDKDTQAINTKYFLREIPALYTAGQIFPLKEVPAPNSRVANTFMVDRLQACVYWMFKKRLAQTKGAEATVKIRDVQLAYPGQSEGSIRKRLKYCAEFRRGGDDSGSWVLKQGFQLPTDEEVRKMNQADDVVLYECMQAGFQRLQDFGIDRVHNVIAPNTLGTIDEDHPARRAARIIEEELLLTPWHLTSNFVQALENKCLLQLTGFGDPSGRGEAFSFLRLPMKMNAPKQKEREEASIINERMIVTGTSADLRKLSLDAARLVLLDFGIPENEIPRGRWDRIALVRKLSSEAKAGGEDNSSIVKFARGARYNVAHLQEQIDTKLQTIFNNQIRALSADEVVESDSGWSSDDDSLYDDLERDIESQMMIEDPKTKKRKFGEMEGEKEDADKLAFEKFLKEAGQERGFFQENSKMIGFGDLDRPQGELIKRPHQPQPGQQYYLKRTRTIMTEEGHACQVIDIITNPTEVKQLLDKKKRQLSSYSKRPHLTEEDEQKKDFVEKRKT